MSFLFDLAGCKPDDIKTLTADDLYSNELTNALYKIENKSELLRIKGLLQSRANKLDIGPDFKEYVSQLETEIDEWNDSQDYSHRTAFGIDGWKSLNCGVWIADRKGVRKKTAKLSASMIPIQPVELLENKSTGVEKVKLQYFKNGRTQYQIVERNMIAAKSNIVKLASRGIEVNSENAGQLVQYLSDVINLNPLPVSTAYSQMGWHDDKFIPYDKDAVFDGEDNNRFIFNSVKTKGTLQDWVARIGKYRKNTVIRLTMGASFASVLLERLGALPFVFHLWGKSGTGKTVALMIAMSIWGNPAAGKLTRTLNMTQNALIGQAAYLNSLPFAGDELQTIKERKENYDKLIMRCTEGIDRGRMLDATKAAETKRWRCAFLFTGEDRCTRPNSGAGVKNRCVEVELDSNLFEKASGNEIVNFICSNYGTAGKEFIKKLQAVSSESLRREFNSMALALSDFAGSEPKQAAAMAAILLADTLARESFWPEEKPLSFDDVLSYVAKSEEIDIAQRAYAFIVDDIAKNRAKFIANDNNRGDLWGKIQEGTAFINATVLKKELQAEGFEFSSVAQSWAKKGYILKSKDGKSSVSTWVDGIKARYVMIALPNEPEDDENDYGGIEL